MKCLNKKSLTWHLMVATDKVMAMGGKEFHSLGIPMVVSWQ